MFRRIEVQSHHVHQLFLETRIVAELERPRQMRFQAVGRPYPTHGVLAHANRFGHRPRTPMRRGFRLFPRGLVDDPRYRRAVMAGVRPGREASFSIPGVRKAANRVRHRPTVGFEVPSSAAML